ncbi:hypothetical protein BBJ28_00023898 [Nothophytophthora sp. Chile5]|nr:hypothetical protein BBJ28_00023898 [Nothophytophthora sp. Chile5]
MLPHIPRTEDVQQTAKHEQPMFYFGMDAMAGSSSSQGHPSRMCEPSGGYGSFGFPYDANQRGDWRETDTVVHGLRTRNVVLIEQMLSNHDPHDVLTQVPENYDWHSKTFQLAVKIEQLMFTTAASREAYLNESTLRTRVQMLSRSLIQLRKRKNMISESFAAMSM